MPFLRTSGTSSDVRDASLREKLGSTLLFVSVSGFGFLYVDAHNAAVLDSSASLPLETALDAHTPFLPGFVFAYVLYYPWVLLPLAILRKREPFFRTLVAFGLLQLCACAIFILFPSHMVRPTVAVQGLAGDLVRFIYSKDMGWNVFPSLHVGHSVLVALLFFKYERKLFPFVAAGSTLISASTVLIKQHYVIDIPAGAALAWVCYRAADLAFPVPALAERASGLWRPDTLMSRRNGKRDSPP